MANYLPDIILRRPNGRKYGYVRRRTIADLIDAMKWSAQTPKTDRKKSRGSSLGYGDWHGATMPEYIKMLEEGWPQGVEGAEGLDGLSTDDAERLQFVRSVGGAFPVVPAYLAGAPDNMLEPRPLPVDSTRGLTLVIPAWFHAGVNPKTALEYSRTVMRLIAWLQSKQIQTNIYCVLGCWAGAGNTESYYAIQVRRSEDVLQPERVAACVHPAFMRRAWFSLIEYEGEVLNMRDSAQITRNNYGTLMNDGYDPDALRKALPDVYSVIILPQIGRGDPEKAVKEALSLKLRKD